ncbi:hypothetical protein ACFL20_02775 [Spirochaetota bacterium]
MDGLLSNTGFWTLMTATFILAVTHTVNPDHWFPFVMVGRANKWRISWVLGLALIAGIGHVGTSVIIGLTAVFAEKGASKDVAIFLENATPFLLMVFGFAYALYAYYKHRVGKHGHSHGISFVNKWLGIDPHAYDLPDHEDHENHNHDDQKHGHHHHKSDHGHNNMGEKLKNKKAGWGLVAIIGLTPCIALLPLTMAAVKYGNLAIILVNVSFAVATLATILLLTWFGSLGLSWLKFEFFDEYGDIITGIIIGLIGASVKVFGL